MRGTDGSRAAGRGAGDLKMAGNSDSRKAAKHVVAFHGHSQVAYDTSYEAREELAEHAKAK